MYLFLCSREIPEPIYQRKKVEIIIRSLWIIQSTKKIANVLIIVGRD